MIDFFSKIIGRDKTKDAKTVLAKLMAMERITVEHRKVPGPFFDTKKRILTLPIWKDMSEDLYDLMIGHEVGHALETPNLELIMPILVKEIDPKNPKGVASFFNIVEDVRIEKLIKRRYPGLKAPFVEGYAELIARGFFNPKDRPVEDYNKKSFPDRLNLHFKLGSLAVIDFTKEEQKYLDQIDACETWDEVVQAVKDLYAFCKDKMEEQKQQKQQKQNKGKLGENSSAAGDIEGTKGTKGTKVEKSDGDTGDTDGESSEDEEQAESVEIDILEVETDRAWEDNKKQLIDITAKEITYCNIPLMKLDDHIVPYKETIDKLWTQVQASTGLDLIVSTFKNSNMGPVNFLVKEFEMRKAADQYNRSLVAKTGVIDTNRIFKYQYSEDIFKRVSIIPGGKNHGLMMYIDWSSSMSTNIAATIDQLLVLVLFCRKVKIPFQVFAFTSHYKSGNFRGNNAIKVNDDILFGDLNLLEFFSPTMSRVEFEQMFAILLHLRTNHRNTKNYNLGSTPLDQAIIVANDGVTKFRKKTSAQIVNVVFLTDGDSDGCHGIVGSNVYGLGPGTIVRDPVTRFEYKMDQNITTILLQALKDRMRVNNVGFFIMDNTKHSVEKYFPKIDHIEKAKLMEELKNKNCLVCKSAGYDEYYLVPQEKLQIGAEKIKWTGNIDTVSKDFDMYNTGMMVNRVLLTNFIKQIS